MESRKPPSGRKIWQEIRREMEDNLYRLPFSTVAPALYHVYLHAQDYAEIEGIIPRIVAQAQRALNEEVQRRNEALQNRRKSPFGRVLPRREEDEMAPIELPPGGWEIYIRPDRDDKLSQGYLGIVSRLVLPPEPQFDSGTPTTRIVKTVIGGGTRTRTQTDVRATQPTGTAGTAAVDEEAPRDAAGAHDLHSVRARLTYRDDEGAHTFVMRKDEISVGRGGTAAWVDVTLATGAKVSREHFRLRRDRTGTFFIRDLSAWGTWVNGVRVPAAAKTHEGAIQPGPEHAVPATASIDCAQMLTIDFQAEPH